MKPLTPRPRQEAAIEKNEWGQTLALECMKVCLAPQGYSLIYRVDFEDKDSYNHDWVSLIPAL